MARAISCPRPRYSRSITKKPKLSSAKTYRLSLANAGTGGNANTVNPFQTIERKDVGLTLKVKPQIGENGSVRLTISQEVSSVQASSVGSSTGLITNKRSIDTNVVVADGSIIVLGGLLQDEFADQQQKVPGLGDVPLFGNLFKSEARSRKKTNLMVFIRPVVMKDHSALDALSMDRYDFMRASQQSAQPIPSGAVPINEGPKLPEVRPRPPGTAPAMPATSSGVTPAAAPFQR
jgi:general secretion pathway protein D